MACPSVKPIVIVHKELCMDALGAIVDISDNLTSKSGPPSEKRRAAGAANTAALENRTPTGQARVLSQIIGPEFSVRGG
jgi:hypothetical protein